MENPDKRYKVVISNKVIEMLISHARFLAQVSEQAAQNLIKSLLFVQSHWKISLNGTLGLMTLLYQ